MKKSKSYKNKKVFS